ncbi:hypothetical protein [Microvirga tunisiensis]|uniref:Uncharacterized protein n=1 Tax=Microvirga tunisiensis TaxID=2108360 RepID=A0A5N7MV97_9HYPH|nr:hypothetical protein [Microvirga tunisiensis]MPR13002.1 hypothetical protein [Microvirga tunisiensis]MPR30913.1 hypothetical protein [Microvirga tunisiensis]
MRPPVGGGFGGVGGFRGGIAGVPGGIGGFRGGAVGIRPGFGGFPGGAAGIRPGFGYRPAAIYRPGIGRYGVYSPYYRNYYGRRYPYYGGAVAAGVIGGLALGALSSPYYYGYPYGYDYPYYGVSASYADECYWERRRVVGPRGRIIIRRVQVCYY